MIRIIIIPTFLFLKEQIQNRNHNHNHNRKRNYNNNSKGSTKQYKRWVKLTVLNQNSDCIDKCVEWCAVSAISIFGLASRSVCFNSLVYLNRPVNAWNHYLDSFSSIYCECIDKSVQETTFWCCINIWFSTSLCLLCLG